MREYIQVSGLSSDALVYRLQFMADTMSRALAASFADDAPWESVEQIADWAARLAKAGWEELCKAFPEDEQG